MIRNRLSAWQSKLLLCGNGGSVADCEHIVGELMKGYFFKRPIRGEVRRKLAEAYGDQGIYLADHLQGAYGRPSRW